ncbi:TonB-dependent receptor [Pseudoalteromonas sp. NBT06-2]|uniref:TonB-dependent receptor plug domain-containing protein n=1 Tax=Pseudoalteromonas sp. NBT06-2 TaxID=2025950 RepID=UPI0020752BC9|nr:TonB-dependent receptor [Pseudoalteromonas sp. NBT06-2]
MLGLAVSVLALPALTVRAAEQQAVEEDVERIQIIGSRRNDRTVSESTVPIDVLDIEDMATTGQLEVSQILSNLVPSFNYPNSSIADGTDHARPAVLRGLAPDHTLVLINGKRRHSGALLNLNGTVGRGSTAVDLNTIPTSAIKRIEILRDGAAAQYGSDAIAGVINIILKDGDGGSITASYGEYNTTMDGVAQLESTSIDENGDLAFITSDDRTRNDGGVTTISADWGIDFSDSGFVHISFESRDRAAANRSGFDPREQYARDENGSLDPRELTFDRYNHKFGKAKVEDIAFFYNMGANLTNEIELYSFGSYAQRDGLSAGFYRRAKDSRNVPEIYSDGFLPHIVSDVADQALVLGVKGEIGEWNWDVSANYGKNDFNFMVTNSLNASQGANSQTSFNDGNLLYDQMLLNLSLDTMVDMGLPNDVFVAFGAEYRSENYQIVAGEEASYITILDEDGNPVAAGGAQVLSGFSPASAVDQERHNIGLFFELDTDFTDDFNLAFAGRYEDFSDFGTNFNVKLASRWALSDELALRGAISTGFRAPSLAQTSFTSVATVFENSIPNEVGIFPVDHVAAQALGAETLTAEESVNMTLGFVYEVENFNLTLDAYRIEIDDRIVLSENISGDAVVEILQAAGVNNTQRARYFTNAIDTTTQGVDIVATYDYELDNLGSLRLSAALNINDTEVTELKENPAELTALGDDYVVFSDREISRFEKGTPKNKLNLAAVWNIEDLQITLRASRYGEVVDPSSNPDNHEVLKANWITDLDFSYNISEDLKVAVGANNLLDEYPQDTVSNVGYSTFNQIFPYSGFSSYTTDGRFVYGRINYRF